MIQCWHDRNINKWDEKNKTVVLCMYMYSVHITVMLITIKGFGRGTGNGNGLVPSRGLCLGRGQRAL